ncbi:MAG: AsmA family protein, partial [Planctomycetota bacterium]
MTFKKLSRLLFSFILILVLLVLISFAALNFVLGPNIIRQKFLTYISSFWAGKVQIEDVEFNLFKPLKYNGVSFLDPSGRQWAHAETFEVTIEDWPSLKVKIEAIKLDSLKLQLHLDKDGSSKLFNTAPEETDEVNKKLNLPASTIDDISVYLADGNEPALIIGDLSFSSKQNEDLYNFSIISKEPKKEEKFEAVGAINLESLHADVSVKFEHTVRQADTSLLTKVLSGSEDYEGAGHAVANLKISGPVNEPKSLLPKGSIELKDWSLSYKEMESFAKEINGNILLTEKSVG